ncbi:ferredoxin [Lutimaribacter marinistellae]|uniref:Ferredoxin n=1 Tax=Lutimaribacter marinistellae TaxID=1820329 RepID=A0ABV7TI58_9RHOB
MPDGQSTSRTEFASIEAACAAEGLLVMGAFHPARNTVRQLDSGTLILLGAGADFWPVFQNSPEASDGAPDPIDRWSERVVTGLADTFGGTAWFPFGGPPYAPFIDWAVASGRAFSSPTGMLVHDTVGMMISYRGALHLSEEVPLEPVAGMSPCTTCDAPCTTACPVSALTGSAPYDLDACHGYLDTPAGQDCMTRGCFVRRACPVSQGAGRYDAQSALHMAAFHRGTP